MSSSAGGAQSSGPPARTSAVVDDTSMIAEHQYGHEEPHEVSRDAAVRAGSCVKEKTRKKSFPPSTWSEGMHRELDFMKSFPVYEAVASADATSKIWSTRWCHRRKGSRGAISRRGAAVRNAAGQLFLQSHAWTGNPADVAGLSGSAVLRHQRRFFFLRKK